MVLVLSSNANDSPQILREVERAVNRGVHIIPLRIEDVMPGADLEYYISAQHWLDALTPPLELHLAKLAQVLRLILSNDVSELAAPPAPTVVRTDDGGVRGRRLLLASAVLALLLAASFALWPALTGETTADVSQSPVTDTAEQNAPSETVAFEFDSTDLGEWPTGPKKNGFTKLLDGSYVMVIDTANANLLSNTTMCRDCGDAEVEVKVRVTGPGLAGVMARFGSDSTGAQSGYLCGIAPVKGILCLKIDNNVEYVVLRDTVIGPTLDSNKFNTLVMTARGTKFTLMVNGSHIGTFTDATFARGRFGMYGELHRSTAQLKAEFSYLRNTKW